MGALVSFRHSKRTLPKYAGAGVLAGVAAGGAGYAIAKLRRRVKTLETLMPPTAAHATYPLVGKPTPDALFAPKGTGTDYETRLSAMDGYITPNDRFYIRSHSPTPRIDANQWRLTIEGNAVRNPLVLGYEEISTMPQVTYTRALECAGNGRRFFKEAFGVEAEGSQWRIGAIGVAEWTGVRLRDVLERASFTPAAMDVMIEGLDDRHVRRPIPLEKALRADTILALKMNGEPLLPDHGFPARLIVSGWGGIASIKWVGRIEVSDRPLYSHWNTVEYVLVGPEYSMHHPALGPAITEMPVTSVLDLDWPAKISAGARTIHGRSFAGESKVREVRYRVDEGSWRNAELLDPGVEGSWTRWQFPWNAEPGQHEIRVRATDEKGRTQPDTVPWNHHGYLYNAVVAHPVQVEP